MLEFEIRLENGFFGVSEGNRQTGAYEILEKAVLHLHEWVNYRIFCEMEYLPRIHSGCASFNGKRFILAGDKAAGKTTLLCRMLFDGFSVHCDEYVLFDELGVIPYPRKFHLKEGSLVPVPQLEPICRNLKPYPSYFGGNFFFFDPLDAGCQWIITKDRLDTIIYLQPNHGGKTDLERVPKYLMVRQIMQQIDNFLPDPKEELRNLCKLVDSASCYTLHLGSVEEASKMIKDLFV